MIVIYLIVKSINLAAIARGQVVKWPIVGVSTVEPDALGDGQESSPLEPLGPQAIATKVYIIFVIGSQIGELWPPQSATPPPTEPDPLH
jgi:hypothetical protein